MSPKRAITLLLLVFLFILTVSCRKEEEATPTPERATATAVAAQPTATPQPTRVGLGLVSLDDTAPLAPAIIGQNPALGEEAALDDVFEIYFDQPMDETATANALQILNDAGQAIEGEISWPQPRILQFKPSARLKPGSSYQAVLGTTAVTASGQSLLEGLTLTFYTIGDLSVSQVSPVANVSEVAIDSAITVIFNRPVIPLQISQEGLQESAQSSSANPQSSILTFTPPLPGSGEWINTSVYIFRPDLALIGSTTYTAQVNATAVNDLSATGALMDSDYAWQFTTTAPTYRYLNLPDLTNYPNNDYKYLPLDQPIQVVFTQPMDRANTETAVTFTSDDGDTPAYALGWDETNTTLTLTPTELLDMGTWYNFSLSNSAESATGGTLRRGLTWRAKTYLEPQIFFTDPADGETQASFYSSFQIQFTSPMSLNSLKERVIFNPPLANEGIYSQWDWSYRFYGLKPSTSYTVQILPGMTDIYGHAINEGQTIRFTTAPYAPLAYFNFPGRLGVYRQNGSTAAWVSYRNVNSLDVSLYNINSEQFSSLLYGGLVDVNFTPPAAQLVWEQSVPATAQRNSTGYKRFDMLDANGDPLPPGLYFMTLDSPQVRHDATHLQAQPLVVATANLTLKTTASEALVWLTGLDSGAPVADVPVTLYDRSFKRVASGVTDSDGLIYWDDLPLSVNYDSRYYAITDAPDVYGVAISGWSDGVNPYDFGISTDYYLRPNEPTAYVYTDRPVYRPGQPVSFKGVIRTNDDLAYSLPAYEEALVTIRSYQGTVFNETLPLSEFGSFTGQMTLDGEATLGSYFINVKMNGRDIGSGYFDVAEYRKPTFQVNVAADKADVAAGETINVTIDATFFSGGAVVNGDVEWVVRSSDYTFAPGGNFARYSFSSPTRDTGYYYDYYYGGYDGYYGSLIASGAGKTDGRGQLTIAIPADLSSDSGSRTFTIEATVTDIASNQVSGRTGVTVHRSLIYPGIHADRYVGEVGKEMNFDLAVLDWDGAPSANQPLDVAIVERRWYSVQEENESGQVIWRSSVEEIPVTELTATTGSDGRATLPFTPPNGGVFRAYARLRDSAGNEAVASTYLWASGGDYVSWRRGNDHSFDLIADADSYQPGDTAEILIASPFQGEAYALVTVERGHIKSYETIRLTTNSTIYHLPITGGMAPNIFISVMVMKGVDETNPAPDFKVGMAQFTVEREEQELTIDIIPDREIVGPGDTVAYTIRVRDHNGRPVDAEVSLALADLAALAIAAPNSQHILDFFYSQRWLSVNTALLLTRNMDAFNQELEEQIKGGGGGNGDYGVLTIREDFPDTAYWAGQVQTGPDGEATISVTLPDNLTTWRMDARAITQDTLVGQATKDIQSTKPVLVSPVTPRFFVVGDQAQVGTAVHNNSDQAIAATVTLQAEGVVLHSPGTQSVTIPPKQQAVVYWNVRVNDVARVDFVFSVNAGEYSDASRPTLGTLPGQGIPVYRYEVPETVGTSGQLTEGGAVVESVALPILPGYTPSQGELTIELAPSLVAAMTEGLDYLEHYVYECTEQVVSKFLPNVLTTNALQAAGLSDPELERNLQTQVNIALQKLYSRQRPDGGWPWWDGAKSNTLVTAYVVQALVEARDAGYEVRPPVLDNGLRYLRTNLPNVDDVSGRYKLNRQAYLVYVLARAGEPNAREIDRLYNGREGLDLSARGYLAQAIYLMDDADPRLETMAADFITTAIFSASGVHWEEAARDYWNWGSDTRTTAILLDTLIKLQPDSPLVANAVRWLMDNRVNGRWATTQETAWTLMSLTDWIVISGELQPDYQYEVAFNGALLTTAAVTAATVRDTVTLQQDITTLLTDDLNRLALGRTDGPGNLYYTAHMNIYLPVEELRPLDKGIILSRSYYDPDDRSAPITAAELGDIFLARLTIVVPNTLHYALIEDFLPAGLEAVDTSLLTSQQQGAPERYEADDFWRRGYGWWYFDHVELRDEKVVISANYLPAGTYEYVYLVRASTLGEFRVIPPVGQEFYFPEVYGRGAGMIFTVHPQGALPAKEPETTADEPITTDEEPVTTDDEPVAAEPAPIIIGQSANGSDITATRIGTGETAVLLIGGIHAGFAPSTVAVAQQAIDHFTQFSDTLPANVSLYIIPTLNPDSVDGGVESADGRLNGNGVDLNRNWGCNWAAAATWRDQAISGGTAAFSEPETAALRDFILAIKPTAVILFAARGQIVVPGVCDGVSISEELAGVYATAAGYEAGIISVSSVTGDLTDWLDSQGIPAITPLLADYETLDWEVNLAGVVAVVTAVGANR